MNFKFWMKTVLNLLLPGGYGYNRKLKYFREPSYLFESDKHEVRKKHYGDQGWKNQKPEGLCYRDYANYQEYIVHQQQKFKEMININGGLNRSTITQYRLKFYRRFKILPNLLPFDARIICAGARQGTEVEVLRDLGYRNAYGIDLNPGPENPFVVKGDFMHFEEKDASIDMVYSNSVDHAFDLEQFFQECARIIKPDGYAYYDISLKGGGAFETVRWENEEVVFLMMLRCFKSVICVSTEGPWKVILLKGKR